MNVRASLLLFAALTICSQAAVPSPREMAARLEEMQVSGAGVLLPEPDLVVTNFAGEVDFHEASGIWPATLVSNVVVSAAAGDGGMDLFLRTDESSGVVLFENAAGSLLWAEAPESPVPGNWIAPFRRASPDPSPADALYAPHRVVARWRVDFGDPSLSGSGTAPGALLSALPAITRTSTLTSARTSTASPASFAFSSFSCSSNGVAMDLRWPVPSGGLSRALALDAFSALDLYHKRLLGDGSWRWLLRDDAVSPASGLHSLFIDGSGIPGFFDTSTNAPAPGSLQTNVVATPFGFVYTNVVSTAENSVPGESSSGFFRAGTLADSDMDGIPDAFETMVLGTSPSLRDTDGDGLPDGSDPHPVASDADPATGRLSDLDGDSLPDVWEIFRFGGTNAVNSATNATASGFAAFAALGAGLDPASVPASTSQPDPSLSSTFAAPAFRVDSTSPGQILWERTFAIERHEGWEQFYISARPDPFSDESAPVSWPLENMVLEWEDDKGATGSATSLSSSFRLPLSTNSPTSLALRFRALSSASGTAVSPRPLYLLRWTPAPVFADLPQTTPENGRSAAVLLAGESVRIALDFASGHCPGPFPVDLASASPLAVALPSGATVEADGDAFIVSNLPVGAYEFPAPASETPVLRTLSAPRRNAPAATFPPLGPVLLVIAPNLAWHEAHGCDTYHFGTDGGVESRYPLDDPCVADSFRRDATGRFGSLCQPVLAAGIPEGYEDFFVCEDVEVEDLDPEQPGMLRATATVRFGGGSVWNGEALHFEPRIDNCYADVPLRDGCGCDTCVSCDDLDGPTVSSFAFRIALGTPRDGQVSGFVFIRSETSLPDLAPSAFKTLVRDDAAVTDETAPSGIRTIACRDSRGRTVTLSPAPSGVHIDIADTATGDPVNTWDLSISSGALRVLKTSKGGNRMLDRTYTISGGEWTSSDAVSGSSESVRVEDFLDDGWDPRHVESRTIRDENGAVLSAEIVVRRPVGTGDAAVLRQTERTKYPGTPYERNSFARWWDDPDCIPRHGTLRLVHGDDRPWRWTDQDALGRTVLSFEQVDGSELPWELEGDVRWTLEALPTDIDAIATESDYTPLSGDSAHPLDFDVPRTVSRYRTMPYGAPPILLSRTWTTVVRRTEGGIPVVETRTERAGAQDASPGDPRNAVSVSAVYDPDGPGVPFALRGKPVLETGEDGATTVFRHEFGDWIPAYVSPTGGGVAGSFVPSASGAFVRSRSMRVSPSAPHGIQFVSEISETVSDATYGNEVWSATRALLAPSSSPLSDEAVLSEPFEWESRVYDEKNRLRSTLFSDGSSATNSYSCCRLLFSVGRDGLRRDRLSSADKTAYHWADLETGLASLPRIAIIGGFNAARNYKFERVDDIHVVEHRLDPVGREVFLRELACPSRYTNSLSSIQPGHSDTWCAIATTSYPDGTSDHSVFTDPRGVVTESFISRTQTNTFMVVEKRDGTSLILRTETNLPRESGFHSERTEFDGVWTLEETFSVDRPCGGRKAFHVFFSSDGPAVTNRIETSDMLGRIFLVETPLSTMSNVYFDASSRLASAHDLVAGTVESPVYDGLLRVTGTVRADGVASVSDVRYEVRTNGLWRVERDLEISGLATNVVSETASLLTGLSHSCTASSEMRFESGGTIRTLSSLDVFSMTVTEQVHRKGFSPSIVVSKFGRTIRETSSDGICRRYYFDPYGRPDLLRETGAGGEFFYRGGDFHNSFGDVDAQVRLRSKDKPSNALVRINVFDSRGNRIASTNEIGDVSLYGYDGLDRLVSVSGSAERPLRFGYDAAGRRTLLATTRDGSVWDETRWAYDEATGLCTNKTFADSSAVLYTHTPDGKPLRTTTASGRWTENSYDAFGRLASVSTSDGIGYALFRDSFGRVAAVIDGDSAFDQTFLRASDGSVTNETWEPRAAGAEAPVALNRSFDAWGRLSGLSLSAPASPGGHPAFSSATAIEYSTNGLVSAVVHTNNAGRALVAEFAHDCGKVSGVSLGVGSVTVRHSFSRDIYRPELVTEISAALGPATKAYDMALRHDDLGRPVTRAVLCPFEDSVATNAFAYNARSELVSATLSAAADSYAYDEIGNRVSSSDVIGERAYSANCLNQYTSLLCGSAPLREPLYDADGNLTHCGDWEFQWNARGHLVAAIRREGGSVAFREYFAYDWKGRLVSRTVERNAGTETHAYFWDDWLLLRERVVDASNATNDIEYVWGPDFSGSFQGAGGIGGLLAVSVGGDYYFPFCDQIGNVLGYADENGAVAASYEYDAFGNIIASSGPLAAFFRHRFSTKLFDPDTGLCYYGYRWYSPPLGRWLSRDPIEEEGGENLYAFCGNNAVLSYDAFGLDITLTTGNRNAPRWKFANRGFHQEICVDTWFLDTESCCWKKTGRSCFSFGMIGVEFKAPGNEWLGLQSVKGPGVLRGNVYQTGDQGINDTEILETTPCQDRSFLEYLKSLDGVIDTYSTFRHSCRTFSQAMMEEAKRRKENKDGVCKNENKCK